MVNVSASWPGASASDVAEAIAAPLETQLNGVDHMLYMESTSSDEGTYRLSITFAAGTDADGGDRRAKPGGAGAGAAPGGGAAEWRPCAQARQQSAYGGKPLLAAGHTDAAVCQQLRQHPVREALARLPGVGEVQMFGARDYSMRIWLRPDRMNALNITTDDVARALREQNVQGAAGRWAPRRYLTASSRR